MAGGSKWGKSCILTRYIDDTFSESYSETIRIEFNSKLIKVDDKTIKLQIYDMAGHEKYKVHISKQY